MTVIYAEYDSPLGVRYRTELHQAGFGGTAREVSANRDFHDHNYQSLNEREPHKTPLLDSDFTFYFRAETEADKTLLENVFSSDYGDYQIVKKVNGSEVWRGNVQTDRVQYREAAFPFSAQIKARDIEILKGKDFPLVTDEDRVPLIEVFAEILSEAIDIPIYAYTTWKEGSMTLTQDFLAEREIDRFALKTYARVGGEEDEPITMYDALNGLCRNFGFILFQSGNRWRLWQITALADPTSVREFRYNSSGVATGSSLVNLTTAIDGDLFLLNRSLNTGVKSYRSAGARYDHRTIVSGLKLPRGITITGSGSEAYSAFFSSSGDQVINLSGRVTALDDTNNSAGEADIKVRVGQYYFDGNVWTTDVNDRVTIPMTGGGFLIDGEYQYTGFISISTPPVPSDATSPIEIEFFNAEIIPDGGGGNIVPNSTGWSPILEVDNPVVPEESSTAIDFLLTQTKLESSRYDHGALLFGDGPSGNSRGAISRPDGSLTNAQWRRLSDSNRDFYEVLLKEIMDVQRSSSRLISAQLWGGYEPHQIVSYQGENYFFIGGNQTGKNRWNARLFQINIQSAVTDTFATLLKFTADGSTGSATPSGGGTGGGISQSFADGRYNRRSLNGEDFADIPTVRDNLSVYSRAELDATQLQNDIDLVQLGLQDDALFLQKADKGIQVTLTPSGGLEGGGTNDLSANSEFGVSIADSGVTTAKINNSAVTTEKIADLNVTTGKLADNAVTTVKILDANVTNAKLANSTISGKELGTNLDSLTAGNGLTGTAYNGSAPQTFAVGTPSTTTVGGSNGVTATSHTHALDLSGRTLTAGDGLTGLGNLGADRTVNLGTPSTLTVSSTNSTTATSHNHALDLSGRTLTIADDADSVITFPSNAQNLGANRTWTPTVADAGVSQRGVVSIGSQVFKGEKTLEDGGKYKSNFQSNNFLDVEDTYTGVQLSQSGIKSETIRANELRVKAFIAEISAALYGEDVLTKSRGVLSRDFTIPAVSGTATLFVEDLEGFPETQVFEANDFVRLRVVDRSGGGLLVADVWGQVTSYTNLAGGEQSWTFTRTTGGSATTGDIIYAGSIAIDYGTSGDGVIIRSVIGDNTPRETILTWVTDPAVPTNYTLRTRIGNLNGSFGITDDIYGVAVQDNFIASLDGGNLKLGKDADGSGNDGIYFDANNYWLLNEGFKVQIDGEDLETTVGGIQIDIGDLESDVSTIFGDIGDIETDLGAIGGRVVLFTNTDGNVATIELLSGTEGSAVTIQGSQINLLANSDFTDLDDYSRLELTPDLINLALQIDGSYSGIQFLAGQTIISASAVDGEGRAKLARIRLDATGVESVVGIDADAFLLSTNNLFIDSAAANNGLIALGASASGITVANNNAGIALDGAGNFKAYGNADNLIRKSGTSLEIKSETFDLKATDLLLSSTNRRMSIASGDLEIVVGRTNGIAAPNYDQKFGINFGAFGTNPDNYWRRVDGFGGADNYVEFETGDGTEFMKLVTSHGSTPTLLDINTETTRFTNQDVTYKDAVIEATAYSGSSVNINTFFTWFNLQEVEAGDGKALRFWVDYSIIAAGGGSTAYEIQIQVQGYTGSVWETLEPLNLFYVYDGQLDANSEAETVDNQIFSIKSITDQSSFSGTWYLYTFAVPGYEKYRLRVRHVVNDGDLGSKNITANQARAYDRTVSLSKSGLFLRDADILFSKVTALGSLNEIDLTQLVKGTT